MDTNLLIAFLIGIGATILVAAVSVFLTIYVREHTRHDNSDEAYRKSKKKKSHRDFREADEERAGEYTIRLSDRKQSGKTWTRQIDRDGELLIGRGEDCGLLLTDASVGRAQCKIVIGKHGLEVVDLGAKNRTKQNGVFVFSGSRLNRGDVLRLGREELLVESIQRLGREEAPRGGKGETEPIEDEERPVEHNNGLKRRRDTRDVFDGRSYDENSQREEKSRPSKVSSDTKGVWDAHRDEN